MEFTPSRSGRSVILKTLLILTGSFLFITWLSLTPGGLLGKADAIGYAVCHRIDSRSFLIGDRQTPLCARCSGMYLGALLGMVYLSRFGRRGGMPSLKVSVVLALFLAAFGLDGANSYLHFFPQAPGLYMPQNWLRLLTGTGLGIGIAAVLMPVFHQVMWRDYSQERALGSWKAFLPLLALGGLMDLLVLSGNPLLLYPLALLSAAGVFLILVIVYTVVWAMIAKQENRFTNWRGIWMVALAGFCTALLQVAVIDAGRFWLTRTWGGFDL